MARQARPSTTEERQRRRDAKNGVTRTESRYAFAKRWAIKGWGDIVIAFVGMLILIVLGLAVVFGGRWLDSEKLEPNKMPAVSSPTVLPTSPPSPILTPTREPSAYIVGNPKPECDPDDGQRYIEFRFRTVDIPIGSRFRAFARSKGNSKYYPANSIVSYVGDEFVAKIYVGIAESYSLYVFLVTAEIEQNIGTYLELREHDRAWGLGLELPKDVRGLIDRDGIPGCRAPRPTPSPKPAITGRPTRSN